MITAFAVMHWAVVLPLMLAYTAVAVGWMKGRIIADPATFASVASAMGWFQATSGFWAVLLAGPSLVGVSTTVEVYRAWAWLMIVGGSQVLFSSVVDSLLVRRYCAWSPALWGTRMLHRWALFAVYAGTALISIWGVSSLPYFSSPPMYGMALIGAAILPLATGLDLRASGIVWGEQREMEDSPLRNELELIQSAFMVGVPPVLFSHTRVEEDDAFARDRLRQAARTTMMRVVAGSAVVVSSALLRVVNPATATAAVAMRLASGRRLTTDHRAGRGKQVSMILWLALALVFGITLIGTLPGPVRFSTIVIGCLAAPMVSAVLMRAFDAVPGPLERAETAFLVWRHAGGDPSRTRAQFVGHLAEATQLAYEFLDPEQARQLYRQAPWLREFLAREDVDAAARDLVTGSDRVSPTGSTDTTGSR